MKLNHLSVGYMQPIVCSIETELRPGSFVCLTGRNGTGKSTLLKTLAGILPPLEGGIEIAGRPLADFSAKQLAQTVGLVLTQAPDLPNTTLLDLVAYGRLPYANWFGKFTAADYRHAHEAMALLGIEPLAHRKVAELSDGERQKAMIARALAQGTQYLLLDEPSAFLDYPSKLELMQTLKNLAHDQEKGILLSSHDQDLVLRSADVVWHIADQRLTSNNLC